MRVSREEFTNEFRFVAEFAEKKGYVREQSYAAVAADGARIRLRATDTRVEGFSSVQRKAEEAEEKGEAWSVSVPPAAVLQYLSQQAGAPCLSLSVEGECLRIAPESALLGKQSEPALIQGVRADFIPKVPKLKDVICFLKPKLFPAVLSLVSSAVSREIPESPINSVLLEVSGDEITLTATDRSRL
jgi:DNA polymerase III sliding clamp (beta) subunit (PCNA family)